VIHRYCLATMVGVSLIGLAPSSSAITPAASAKGTIRSLSPMGASRAAHTLTPLPNGDALVVGGFTAEEDQLAGAELFAHQQERFIATGRPRALRQSHTATRLLDGKVLIAGGFGTGNQYLDSAELYDPATNTFSLTGRLTAARAGHEAVLLADGRVLLIGGVSVGWTFLASAEIYDPRTGKFRTTGSMSEPRESHVAVKLPDGRVLVAGGHRGRGQAILISATAEIFDAATGRFSPVGAMAIRRHKHDGVVLRDGRVLVAGGADERDSEGVYSSVEVFDPARGRFEGGQALRASRYKHRGTSLLLPDGVVLFAGGATEAETFDPATGEGQLVDSPSPLAGQFSAAALLRDGRVLITGGYGEGRGPSPRAWIYEPVTRQRR